MLASVQTGSQQQKQPNVQQTSAIINITQQRTKPIRHAATLMDHWEQAFAMQHVLPALCALHQSDRGKTGRISTGLGESFCSVQGAMGMLMWMLCIQMNPGHPVTTNFLFAPRCRASSHQQIQQFNRKAEVQGCATPDSFALESVCQSCHAS